MSDRPVLRPLRADEAAEVHALSARTFAALAEAEGEPPRVQDDGTRARGAARVEHLQRTDPEGAWAAEHDGRLVGVALATMRERLWFLSLLVVEPGLQGAGTGARLLEAALRTGHDAAAGWILSSPDPRALRRYALAGFTLEPAYAVTGGVNRALLPAVPDVRDGSWERDGDLVDDVARSLRGAGYGPDREVFAGLGGRLLVTDTPRGQGFALVSPAGLMPLGATTPEAARDLMWAGLAELEDEVSSWFVTARQAWAVDIAVQARLSLRPRASSCHRGMLGPFTPYLPTGAYG